MKRYYGQNKVAPGLYFQTRSLSFESRHEAGTLPGDPTDSYLRVPAVALLIGGPLLGLAYAIFLPFIGFVMLARLIAAKVAGLSADAARVATRSARPSWQPMTAFLSRARQSREKEEAKDDEWARETEDRLREDESDDEE